MMETVAYILLPLGGFIMFLAGLGLVRLPDLYSRMQAATKASTLGVGLIFLSLAMDMGSFSVAIRCVAIIIFMFLTAPVGAHILALVAYSLKTPLWEGTRFDDLKESQLSFKPGPDK